MSHINYSSTVWDGCCKDTFLNINRLHRRAVKIISPIQNTTTEIKMNKLDILPLSEHLKYNKATIIHKIYHEKAPMYLNKLFTKAPDRYESKNLVPPLPRIDLFKTSLSFSGLTIWNDLPTNLKENMSTNTFKHNLYEHLMKNQKEALLLQT